MRAKLLLTLLLSSPALAAPIAVGGQIDPPVKDARAQLIPVVSRMEAGRLELEGKADPEPVASAAVAADGSFRLEAPEPGMYRVLVQAPGHVPQEFLLRPLVEEADLPALKLEKDARLEVKVTGADGKPVPGARVRLGDLEAMVSRNGWRLPIRSGMTDAQGKVSLPRGPSEAGLVRAGAPGFPFAERRDVRASSVTLSLAAGSSRDLRVVDAAGKPVAGALVRLGEPRWAEGLTSADGLLSVSLPKHRLRAEALAADGRTATVYLEPRKPNETGPRVVRLPAGEALSGRVVSAADGKPVAGAVVWAADPGAFQRTGADGGYKLTAAAGDDLGVEALAAGYFRATARRSVKAGERRAPTVPLEPSFAASGVVVDEQGKPVPGVEVSARVQPGNRIRSAARWSSGGTARTSAAGKFRLSNLAAGLAHHLQLRKPGFAPLREDLAPMEAGRKAQELRFVLRRGRTGFGRVVSQAEQPVPGAQVVLERELSADIMIRMALSDDGSGRFEAAAGPDGRFEIAGLPSGTYQLTARGPGFAPVTVPGLAVPEGGGSVDLGTVMLARGVALEGIVTDPKGRPVEGARVRVSEANADPLSGRRRGGAEPDAVSAQDGFFRIADRRSGETLDVDVRAAGYGPGSAPGVRVPSEEPVRIVLQPSSAVEGRAVDPDGKPIAGAQVSLIPEAPAAMGRGFVMFTTENVRNAVSGDDGAFRMEDVPPGTYQLQGRAAGRRNAEMSGLEVRPAQDLANVEVVLQAGAVVEGRVSSGGRPVPGAEVEVAEPETSIAMIRIHPPNVTSDGDGFYRLDGVAPGSRTVRVRREGFSTAARDLEVRAGENVLDFSLDAGAEVSGRVVDEDGVPVAAAHVVIHEGFNSWDLPNAVSQPDGTFTLSGVADGSYKISASKEGYARTDGEPLTVSGNVSGVELRLSVGGAIVGQISGLEFNELSLASVWVDHEFQPGRVSADGSYRVDNVEPGEHRVFASVGGERQTEGRVTLEPEAREARLDLEFADGFLLTGRVLRNGEAVRGENVALGGPGVAGRPWAKTDHEGRFRFEDLEAGRYELTVIDPRGQSHHKEEVDLSRDTEVELDLLAVTLAGRVVDSSDKQPLSGVRVTVQPPRGGEVNHFLQLEAVTDSRGRFRLPDVPGGSWRLQAMLEGYTPGEQAVDVRASSASEELEIALQPTEGITLTVALASGRIPNYVRAAVIGPSGETVASATYPTGDEGRLRVGIVPPGSWELVLAADGGAPVTVPVTAPGNAGRVVLPQPGGLDLKVPALQGMRVGARLTLTDQNGKPFRTPYGEALNRLDLDSGAIKLERLAPGTWTLAVAADDGRTWSGSAVVTPGGMTPVTLD